MFEKEDFTIDSWSDFMGFLLITPFVAFVMPVVGIVWTLGLIEDSIGWLDT